MSVGAARLIRIAPGATQCELQITVRNGGPDQAEGISLAAAIEQIVSPHMRTEMILEGPAAVASQGEELYFKIVGFPIDPNEPMAYTFELRLAGVPVVVDSGEFAIYCPA